MKILAIVGSLRKESYNLQLALAAKKAVGDAAEFEILEYADLPFMNQDKEIPAPEAVKRVREAVKSADGIWFFTPEYNHFFSGVLKNLIDWLSRPVSDTEPQVLAGKPAAISGIRAASMWDDEVVNADGKLELVASAPYLEKQAKAFVAFIEEQK